MATHDSILVKLLNCKDTIITGYAFSSSPVKRYGQVYDHKILSIDVRPTKHKQCRCPKCMKRCSGYDYKNQEDSTWRAPNLNGITVYLKYRPRRIKCPKHGVLTEYIPWADGTCRSTPDFNNEVAWLATKMPKIAISDYLWINWRTVGSCIKAAQDRIEPNTAARMRGLKRICVDETSYQKGHKYVTVVCNMDNNSVVWVHENHGESIFQQFCEALSEEGCKAIELVAGDGARWIDSCVKKYFPNAVRCVDPFHVVEWANEALDDVRTATASKAMKEYNRKKNELEELEIRAAEVKNAAEKAVTDAQKELEQMPKCGRPSKRKIELLSFIATKKEILTDSDKSAKGPGRPRKESFSTEHQTILDALLKSVQDIKGAKYALGKNPENRTDSQNDRIKLIENSYPDLYLALQFKERLRLILHMTDSTFASEELSFWISDAKDSGLSAMEKLSEKIERHKTNIINSITYCANSAQSEATNTTIKALIKLARGFRNLKNMFALIYLKCSDIVIPLFNRCLPSAEVQKSIRQKAAVRKRARQNSELCSLTF